MTMPRKLCIKDFCRLVTKRVIRLCFITVFKSVIGHRYGFPVNGKRRKDRIAKLAVRIDLLRRIQGWRHGRQCRFGFHRKKMRFIFCQTHQISGMFRHETRCFFPYSLLRMGKGDRYIRYFLTKSSKTRRSTRFSLCVAFIGSILFHLQRSIRLETLHLGKQKRIRR